LYKRNSPNPELHDAPAAESLTSVGAILLLFFSPPPTPSSFSLSLASLFMPLTELVVLLGVCGGVVIGMPVYPAVIPGSAPPTNVGLEITVPVFPTTPGCVAMLDVEFDLVGEEGRAGSERLEGVRWCVCDVDGKGDGGAIEVGVAMGVFCEEALGIMGCFAVGTSPLYISPSSPGWKVRVEQKPSEEVIRRVWPSVALGGRC
jgi:hypothetical protein